MTRASDYDVRVAVFGGLRVWRSGFEVNAGPPRQRTVMALLLAAAGSAVAVSDLVDAVWPTAPPTSSVNQIHRLVGQIRRTFEPALSPHASGRLVLAAGAGYRLAVEQADCDLLQFRNVARRADECVNAGDGLKACRVYVEALAHCQGKVFAGLDPQVLARPEIAALERERESVIVAAATVAVGHRLFPPQILAAVQLAASDAPLNETLHVALLRLLAASGRRAEALTAYDVVRRALADELGVDPSSQLAATFRDLLAEQRHEQQSEPSRNDAGGTDLRGRRQPAQIPRPLAGFVDRTDHSADLPEIGDGGPEPIAVTAIGGMAGVGKTALAVQWAHQLADRFPDGQLYVNLRGFDQAEVVVDPADALTQLLESLGEPPLVEGRDDIDARSARYRTLMAGRRMIVVLDNARDSAQVRPLLPGAPECLVLVTSRNRLTSLAAHDGARFVELDRLASADALTLLTSRIGPTRVAAEPAAVERIVSACHGLPLALAIVAGRIATDPARCLADFADELSEPHSRLDALSTGEPDDDLRAVLSWSYRALSPDAARLLRYLAAHPGPETSSASLASMTGLSTTRTDQLARELVNGSLVGETRRTEAGGRRYVVHDLVRAYATELLDGADERGVAERRLIEHYLLSTRSAYLQFGRAPLLPCPPVGDFVLPEVPSEVSGSLAWYSDERSVLVAAVDMAIAQELPLAAALIVLDRRPMDQELDVLTDTLGQCLRVLEFVGSSIPPLIVAELHRDVAWRLQSDVAADVHREAALDIYRQSEDLVGQSNIYRNLCVLASTRQHYELAYEHAKQSVALAERCDQPGILAMALLTLSGAALASERFAEAISVGERTRTVLRDQPMSHIESLPTGNIAEAWLELGHWENSLTYANMAVEMLRRSPTHSVEFVVFACRAQAAFELGDRDVAKSSVAMFSKLVAGDGRTRLLSMGIDPVDLDRQIRRVEQVILALA